MRSIGLRYARYSPFSLLHDILKDHSIQTWGEAYGQSEDVPAPQYAFRPFAAIEHEIPMDGYPSSHYQHTYQSLPKSLSLDVWKIHWPDAMSHPYFYIGIYAAIGCASALTTILSVIAQYTGALRASRILFK